MNYLLYPSRTKVGRDIVHFFLKRLHDHIAFEYAALGYRAVLLVETQNDVVSPDNSATKS